MANTPSITSKEFKKFQEYMDESAMSPLQRCQWNTMRRQYVQMMEMDFKTQDRYEQEVAQLRRQINTQAETIRLKDKTIHEGADDETPLPVLDMMNRLDAMETKYERLRHSVCEAVAEQNDLDLISKLGNEVWRELNPDKDDYGYSPGQIYQDLIQEAIEVENLCGLDAYQEVEDERDELIEERDDLEKERDEWKDECISVKKELKDAQWEAVSLGETLAEIPNWAKKTPKTLNILNDFMERSDSWGEYRTFVKEYYPEEPHTDSEEEEEPEPAQEDPNGKESSKSPDGMTKFLMDTFPEIKQVPKMEKFMSQRGHIKMEQADTTNNTKWFAEMVKRGYLPAMKKHREMTNCFDWNNWDAWVKTRQ